MSEKINILTCVNCGFNDHVDCATYCQKCGISIYNFCPDDNCIANDEDEVKNCVIPQDALYCPYCGEKSLHFEYLSK